MDFSKSVVKIINEESGLYDKQQAKLLALKTVIDAEFVGDGAPVKGTEYRSIVYQQLVKENIVIGTLTEVLKSGTKYGTFLKRFSDYIRNNFGVKEEKPEVSEEEKRAARLAAILKELSSDCLLKALVQKAICDKE